MLENTFPDLNEHSKDVTREKHWRKQKLVNLTEFYEVIEYTNIILQEITNKNEQLVWISFMIDVIKEDLRHEVELDDYDFRLGAMYVLVMMQLDIQLESEEKPKYPLGLW